MQDPEINKISINMNTIHINTENPCGSCENQTNEGRWTTSGVECPQLDVYSY